MIAVGNDYAVDRGSSPLKGADLGALGAYILTMPTVNPDILKWARETAGLTFEVAAAKLDIGEARGVPEETKARMGTTRSTQDGLFLPEARRLGRQLAVLCETIPGRRGA